MKKLIAIITLLTLPLLACAQLPIVDITMVHVDDHYEVRIRPDGGDYQGVFSSILFTVKWNSSSPDAGEFIPSSEAASYGIFPTISGDITDDNGMSYAIYAGFGFQTISPNWVAGQEILLGTFPDDGQSNFQLMNDAWTSINNGDYYLSLNGSDRTGIIYQDFPTGIEKIVSRDLCLSMYPNPTNGVLKLVMDLPHGGPLFIGVIDQSGRVVKRKTINVSGGISTQEIDLSNLTSGKYTIQTRMGEQVSSLTCVLER